MDDWLIFQYCIIRVINVVRTEKDMRAAYWMAVQGRRIFEEANPFEGNSESPCGGVVRHRKT